MRRRHGSGRRVTPPCGGRPRREPPRMKSAEWRHLMRSPSQGDQRQAFMLLEKMRTTLAEAQGKAGCVGLRHKDGHGPGIQGRPSSGRAEASTARVATAAPSTLSLSGQAAHLKTGRERLKAQCRAVAVPSEWILSGQAVHPRPHPKNVRYLEEYKLKERCADGTIVAVPCSLPDNTNTTAGKKKKKKCVVCESQAGKEDSDLSHQEETHTGLQMVVSVRVQAQRGEVWCVCVSQAGKVDPTLPHQEETHTGLQMVVSVKVQGQRGGEVWCVCVSGWGGRGRKFTGEAGGST
ncbi:uncharacterized protein LOC126989514 [Eriocheir sinensis]|uniref:uncharacterized protein LOC126989514 n=1 Tax=Eriocheir sinensis TaxID=95602 RepID=UPI0021C9407A|nr:uncharacterized protein LOC126989514 [Eriocheir sinensis]